MKLFTLLMIALIYSVAPTAAEGSLRKLEKKVEDADRELEGGMHIQEVSIEREFDDSGKVPEGRAVAYDEDHVLPVPPSDYDADHHGRNLATYYCTSCYYYAYYGYLSYCCSGYSCGYYYC